MFFKKKKVNEQEVIEQVVEPVVEEEKPKDAIEEWGYNGKAIVNGYVIRAVRQWNLNNPKNIIPEEELKKLLTGLKMVFTGVLPEKAIATYEEYIKKEG